MSNTAFSCKKANLTCTELCSCFDWHNTAPKSVNDEDIPNDIPGEIRSSDEDDWDKFIGNIQTPV